MVNDMGTDKELVTSLIEKYHDLQRILNADDQAKEVQNQLTYVKAQLAVCGVNVEDLKLQ